MDGKGTWEDYELTRDGRPVYVNLAYEWTFEGEDTDGTGAVYPADFTIGRITATCSNCRCPVLVLDGKELEAAETAIRETLVEEREERIAAQLADRYD